jgi:hypothetical protein
MRHLAVLLLLLALPALAAPTRHLYETQTLTRARPSVSSEGMSLTAPDGYPVRGFMVSVCAEASQTLTGGSSGGRLRAWVYHPDATLWMRNPELDLSVTVAGERCQAWPDLRTGYMRERRVLFAADSVLVSGGSTIIVRIDADTAL